MNHLTRTTWSFICWNSHYQYSSVPSPTPDISMYGKSIGYRSFFWFHISPDLLSNAPSFVVPIFSSLCNRRAKRGQSNGDRIVTEHRPVASRTILVRRLPRGLDEKRRWVFLKFPPMRDKAGVRNDLPVALAPVRFLRVRGAPLVGDAVIEEVATQDFDLFLFRRFLTGVTAKVLRPVAS